jgi:hypothetical protein
MLPQVAKELAEKLIFGVQPLKGRFNAKKRTASLKRCPDTNPRFSENCKAAIDCRYLRHG